ncbi:universal stress protein [soil metagenome]
MTESLPARATVGLRPHIVVGVDGSPESLAALRQARVLAQTLGGGVEAVSVWEFPASALGYLPAGWSPEDDAKTVLQDAVHAVFGETPPAWLAQTTVEGAAARSLIEESEKADLLIVGSRGHGGFAGLLLGSVSAACAAHAHCPVLIVRDDRLLLPGELPAGG